MIPKSWLELMSDVRRRGRAPLNATLGGLGVARERLAGSARRFRGSKAFLPASVGASVLAVIIAAGSYASWDAKRVDIPEVIGQPLPVALSQFEDLGLEVTEPELPDDALDANCYSVSEQSAEGGSRVMPADTVVRVEFEPTVREVPDLAGLTYEDAKAALLRECLHAEPQFLACVADDFSGGAEALLDDEVASAMGFRFDQWTFTARYQSPIVEDSWVVCDQARVPSSQLTAGAKVALYLAVPLTTVPQPAEASVAAARTALRSTQDGCTLTPRFAASFPADPEQVRNRPLPPLQDMADWSLVSLTPGPGQVVLCNETVRVEAEWPATSAPQVVGQYHVAATGQSETAATAAIESAGLLASCTGRGTVTSQEPAAGTLVPVGTSIKCVAELVMPNIVGMDPGSAAAALSAAGISAHGSGSGIVTSQSPAAGTVLTGTQSASYQATQPAPPPSSNVYYKNCTAAREAGAAPVYRGQPGYGSHLDRDNDGIGCE